MKEPYAKFQLWSQVALQTGTKVSYSFKKKIDRQFYRKGKPSVYFMEHIEEELRHQLKRDLK
jgi:hypothetical protein